MLIIVYRRFDPSVVEEILMKEYIEEEVIDKMMDSKMVMMMAMVDG